MFERFTGGARHLVVDAQEQARVMLHPSIGSEHLLLALTRVGGGVAGEVLEARGVSEAVVRVEIDRLVGGGAEATEQVAAAGHIPFTPNAKKTLELALRESRRLGHDAISCEHVAIALTSESYTVAARVLTALHVDPAQLRSDLLARADEFAAALEDVPDAPAGLSQSAVLASPSRSIQRRAAFAGPWGRPFGGVPTRARKRQCSLCGRSERAVERLLVARGVVVCDVCVRSLSELLAGSEPSGAKVVRFRPPEAVPADREAAIASIEAAFAVVFGVARGSVDEQANVIEDGPALRDFIVEWMGVSRRYGHVAVDVTVEQVRFVDEHEAEVSLGIWMPGNTTAPMVQPAGAVEVEGEWKVSRDTVARFAGMIGVECPPADDD